MKTLSCQLQDLKSCDYPLSLAVLHDWELEALDIKIAFLFGEWNEEIYMK